MAKQDVVKNGKRVEVETFIKAMSRAYKGAKSEEEKKTLRGDLRAFANCFEARERASKVQGALGDSFRALIRLYDSGSLMEAEVVDLKADARAIASALDPKESRLTKILGNVDQD